MFKHIPLFAFLFLLILLFSSSVAAQGSRSGQTVTKPMEAKQELKVKAPAEEILERENTVKPLIQNKEEFQKIREERMSEVSRQVKILQEDRGESKFGIGEKVREIAKTQEKAQERVVVKLKKLEERKNWVKKIIGYDKETVNSVKEEIEENRSRAEELLLLKEESTDNEETAEIEAAIAALAQQNAYLQESILEETKYQGFFARIRDFLAKN